MMVARDGVEPPTPAFSVYSLSLNPFFNQQLNSSRWPVYCDHSVTSADVRLSVGWRNDELKICIVRPLFLYAVLFVADLLHPINHLAVLLFLNGDVRHSGRLPSPMPVFLFRWEPDHITRADFFHRS